MTEPIARIEAALARLGAEHQPPAGWEARVLAATAARKRRPWWLFPIPIAVLAMAGAIVVAIPSVPFRPPSELVFSADQVGSTAANRGRSAVVAPVGQVASTTVHRGQSAAVGDVWRAVAVGGHGYRAIWVYLENRLVVACPRDLWCRNTEDMTDGDIVLSSVGHYIILAFTSSSPIPAPTGGYDADLAAAKNAGAVNIHETKLQVR